MNRLSTLFLYLVTFFTPLSLNTITQGQLVKPRKIIAFTLNGGYGHMAACELLQKTFVNDTVKIVNPFSEIIQSCFKALPIITLGKFKANKTDDFYNYLLQNQWVRTLNHLVRHQNKSHFHRNRKKMERLFTAYFKKEKPDIIISPVSWINYAASQAAHKCNIPFLMVSLDADLSFWINDMERSTNPSFHMTVGAMTQHLQQQINSKKIKPNQITIVGHALRHEFFTPKNKELIKEEWKLPKDKPLIMIIRGGSGSSQMIDTVKNLKKAKTPLHLMVCIGKNEKIGKNLQKINLPPHITMTIIPFTKKMADIMTVADALISQPTPNVCKEAMHLGVPILFDMTQPTLFWERRTIDWAGQDTIFTIVKKEKQMVNALTDLLKRPKLVKKTEDKLNFSVEIVKVVNKMCPPVARA